MRLSCGAYLQIMCCSSKQLIDENQSQRSNADFSVIRCKVFFPDELFVFVNGLNYICERFYDNDLMSH